MRWIFGVSLLLLVPASCSRPGDEELEYQSGPSPSAGDSCAGSCGQKSPDESCWCDPECVAIGDCCADLNSVCSFPEDAGKPPNPAGGSSGSGGTSGGGVGGSSTGGSGGSSTGGTGSGGVPNTGAASCAGVCGGPATGEVCWCDAECESYGDCCTDFAQVCSGAPSPTGGDCTQALCGTETPVSQNGVSCYCDAACVDYGDCCANAKTTCGF